MRRLTIPSLAAATLLLAAATSPSQASFMDWSYTTASTPPVITSGTGSVQVTGVTTGTAGASIPILGIQGNSAATAGSPDAYNSHFNVAMTVTDNATQATGTLNLSGQLAGALTASTSSVVASFAPASLTLGGHVYNVNVPSLSLAAPGQPQQSLLANVTVADASPTAPQVVTPNVAPPSAPSTPSTPGATTNTPEPTSLVLGGLGWSLLSVAGWRKRSRRGA